MTPEYVYRSWGGAVSIEDITQGLTELRKLIAAQWIYGFTNLRTHGVRIDGLTEGAERRIYGVTDLRIYGDTKLWRALREDLRNYG